MIAFPNVPQPETAAGVASAEDGLVILDGPNGVAVTMTPEAAIETGKNLISAAATANEQISGKTHSNI